MADGTKGSNIFIHSPFGSEYSSIVAESKNKVMYIRAGEDVEDVLNQILQLGQSSYYAITYPERAKGRLHDLY